MDLIETQLENPLEHWYYAHKYWAITELMNRNSVPLNRLIDVGAGSAVFSKAIKQALPEIEVFAIDTGYSENQLGTNSDGVTYLRNPGAITGDCYLMTDVIEHVRNDLEFLKSYADLVSSGTYFIITAPAFMSLWSNHDIYLKHFRRYTKNEIMELSENAGLEVIEARYLYGVLFPLVWIKRRLIRKRAEGSDLRQDSNIIQAALKFILEIDKLVSRKSRLGISAIAICRKK
jgi:hypothetical protein